ncbi:MAG: DUF4332 domain-containing protein [Elusimicrobia bacterium]|nr:DUF4332 domain-containing protein [Elusimicrobiota bacterium]
MKKCYNSLAVPAAAFLCAFALRAAAGPDLNFDQGINVSDVISGLSEAPQPKFIVPTPRVTLIALKKNRGAKTKLEAIEGIGPVYADRLRDWAGIATISELLEAGAAPKGRKEIERSTGIGHKLVLGWVNRADMMRIRGISEEYSDLLEKAGVDTVKELRNRVPENLHKKLLEVNGKKKLVRRVPALSQVTDWVWQANWLAAIVTY